MGYKCSMNRSENKEIFAMTQLEVSKALGVDQKTVSRCERIAMDKIKKILIERGITADILEN